MWFAEQLNSFLTLGDCKEYPIMARSKFIPGNKASTGKEQVPVNVSDVKALAAKTPSAELAPEAKVAPTVKTTPEARKLEVVKNDSRKNLVPINLEDEIRQRAYELYQQRGSRAGSEAEDWLTAESEVLQRYRQQSA
jgi:Protein of unknown function (DUF2934)